MLPRPKSIFEDWDPGDATGVASTRSRTRSSIGQMIPIYRTMLANQNIVQMMLLQSAKEGGDQRRKYDASGGTDSEWINALREESEWLGSPGVVSTFQQLNAMDAHALMKRLEDAQLNGWNNPTMYTAEWHRYHIRALMNQINGSLPPGA